MVVPLISLLCYVEQVSAYKKLHFYMIVMAAGGFCYETPESVTPLIILNVRERYWFTELEWCDRKLYSAILAQFLCYLYMTEWLNTKVKVNVTP